MRRSTDGAWTVNVWSGDAGEIATGIGRRRDRRRDGGLDRAAGRVEDGARRQRRLRRRRRSTATRSGSASARRSCSGSSTGGGRSRCGTSTCSRCSRSRSRSGSSTAATSSPRCRSSTRPRLAARALPLDRPRATARRAARRCGRCGCCSRRPSSSPASAIGLNVARLERDRRRLRGRDRRRPDRHGQSPYGNFPVEDDRPKCGPADAAGEVRERIQTNGRCESANAAATRTGPSRTSPTCPATSSFGWSGKWDTLPAAHATTILWDLLACSASLSSGGGSGASTCGDARVRLGRVAVLAVRLELEHERPDPARPARLGLLLRELAGAARRVLALVVGEVRAAPARAALEPATRRRAVSPGRARSSSSASRVATALAFCVLLLEPSPPHAARVFYDRTIGWQVGRESPFSLWDWGQYHARGIPDLHLVQHVLQAAARPRRRSRSGAGRAAARRSSSPRSPPRC